MTFGILAEDISDAETLEVIIKRVGGNVAPVRVKKHNAHGGGNLFRKGARYLQNFRNLGATHFIVCHDADGGNEKAKQIRDKIMRMVVKPAACERVCVVIPIQELEAWLIADHHAIMSVIPTLKLQEVKHPEKQNGPKEWIVNQSRVNNARPLYLTRVHNPQVAKHVNIQLVAEKCPSFIPFLKYVKDSLL